MAVKDFLINTKYEMDMLVLAAEVQGTGGTTTTIPHTLGFAPLPFACAYDENNLPVRVSVSADQNNIYATPVGNASATIHAYAFEPSDSRASIAPTSKRAKTFILNSNHNYLKLKQKGVVEKITGQTLNFTINHSLGYLPQILAWAEGQGTITEITPTTSDYISITTETATIHVESNKNKIHYRLYYDEA